LVEQDPISREYSLGVGLLEMGHIKLYSDPLLRLVHPYLHYLTGELGEAVYVTTQKGSEMLVLLRAIPGDLRDPVPWVTRNPLHCTSSGKILLARMEEDELATLMEKGLPRFTAKTITDPAKLRAELEVVREQGFATCFEEYRKGVNAIAVPCARSDGRVVATLSTAGHAYSLTHEKAMHSLEILRGVATEISLKLG
jgi:DNA-binding IclR family transcriptional regulator